MYQSFKKIVLCGSILCANSVLAQQGDADSTAIAIQPVAIKAYFSEQPLLRLPASGQVLSRSLLGLQQPHSLLSSINTIAGIRMEERSPGSYRLAMRGSLIRSPFGIRNTKIYIDEMPFTDAGGNSYLNLIDPAALASIHVLKGPDGSLYGANSGGVIRIMPNGLDEPRNSSSLSLMGGSYGLFNEQLSLQRKVNERYSFSIDQGYLRSDGYRDHTALSKKTLQTAHQWSYRPNHLLKIFALYSDLGYQTPGGLTAAQYESNPRGSRPAAGPNPSAEEQKAAIYNKTWYGGIQHQAALSEQLIHHVSVFGSLTDFENPFISNYEFRTEKNLGIRTFLNWEALKSSALSWQMQLGLEAQHGWYQIDNYDNNQGHAGNAQAKDHLINKQSGLFYRSMLTVYDKWTIEGSLGYHHNAVSYTQQYPLLQKEATSIPLGDVWMPRLAMSYQLHPQMALRASIAKGFSAPTVAEIRSSDNSINEDLQAEQGTNYELGWRWHAPNRRWNADLALYNYRMNSAIVRQLRDSGAEYYQNAGKIDQQGIEASFWAQLIPFRGEHFLRSLSWQSSISYNDYRFKSYRVDQSDYSGNALTAVPDWVLVHNAQLHLPQQIMLNLQHNYTAKMPLNDGNTFYAASFHLVQAKASWSPTVGKRLKMQFFVGVDNLLNEKYSLGNDINAFGNRFFNAAPARNYFAGLKISQ